MASQNELAARLKSLHQPGHPLVLANVYDGATAAIVASLSHTYAIATASYAVAGTYGVADPDLTREQNLAAIGRIAPVVARANLPLTVDLQDGYDDVAATIQEAISLGAVGCNLEDVDGHTGELRPVAEAVERLKTALTAAAEAGVPDFVLNARTDALLFGGTVEDAIDRGKAYLAAGAVTVYIWGGSNRGGISTEEVQAFSERLEGRINVKMNLRPGALAVPELRALGVSRISVGPELYHAAMGAFRESARQVLGP